MMTSRAFASSCHRNGWTRPYWAQEGDDSCDVSERGILA